MDNFKDLNRLEIAKCQEPASSVRTCSSIVIGRQPNVGDNLLVEFHLNKMMMSLNLFDQCFDSGFASESLYTELPS